MKTIPGFHPSGARATALAGHFFGFAETAPCSLPALATKFAPGEFVEPDRFAIGVLSRGRHFARVSEI